MKRKKIYTTPSASCTLLKADNPLLAGSTIKTGGSNATFKGSYKNDQDPDTATEDGNVSSNPFGELYNF